MSLDQGGHLTHGSPVNFSGMTYHFVAYGLGEDERIDYDALRRLAAASTVRAPSWPAPAPMRASSTSRACARSPTRSAPT